MVSQPILSRQNTKYRDWLTRYGYAEVAGLMTTYAGYLLGYFLLDSSPIFAAYLAAIAENIGYYGVMCIRESLTDHKQAQQDAASYGFWGTLRTLGKLLAEFGPAELVDTFFIRPFCIGLATQYLGVAAGVFVGKLASDVVFYIPVIISYEARKVFFRAK